MLYDDRLWRCCLVDCRYLTESSFLHVNKAIFVGRICVCSSMDGQQLWAVKFKTSHMQEIIVVLNEDCAIVGYIWLTTESDWLLESSI
jgi:hypothetical protein